MIKYLLIVLTYLFFSLNSFAAEKIKEVIINGNERISDDTIKIFSELNTIKNFNENEINNITKALYETNYFSNINITFKNNILIISVEENPIIQNITFKGVKSDNLKDEILKGIKLKSRTSYNEFLLDRDREIILYNLKNKGYYLADVSIYKTVLEDNKIDLILDINLGNKSKIEKISFLGNKIFKDRKLKNIIISEENKFWKFLSKKKYLNEEIIRFDKNLLKNFYLNKGYYDVVISSSFAKIKDNGNFELIYNINAKNKFFFGEFKLKLPDGFNDEYFEKVSNSFIKFTDKPYSLNSVEKILEDLEIVSIQEEYQSIVSTVDERIVSNKINLSFEIQETEKYFVNKINIFGNNVTQENVIRNQLKIDEGDPYNDILAKKSINSIKSLGFFKDVREEVVIDETNKQKNINIIVKEKPTGEILAGAGVGTSGGTATFSVKENNYLGRGIGLQALASFNKDSIKGKLSISNPNFNNTDKSAKLSIESSEKDLLKTSGYKSNKTGFSISTNFEYLDDLMLGLGQSSFYEKISTNSTASARQKLQKGNYWDSFIFVDIDYDKRNQKFQTSDGFRSFYSIDLPIISETNTLTNTYSYIVYDELYQDNVLC